jgi:hypothetical protein
MANPVERFLTFVYLDGACWRWSGYLDAEGYAHFGVNHRRVFAHRWAYENYIGPIPEGYHVDHVASRGCVCRDCVNPDHLEAVTPGENVRRSSRVSTDHCKRGHLLDRVDANDKRFCRTCMIERKRQYRLRRSNRG